MNRVLSTPLRVALRPPARNIFAGQDAWRKHPMIRFAHFSSFSPSASASASARKVQPPDSVNHCAHSSVLGSGCWKEPLPGLGYASIIFSGYLALGYLFSPSGHHHAPEAKHVEFEKEEIGAPPVSLSQWHRRIFPRRLTHGFRTSPCRSRHEHRTHVVAVV